MHRSAKGPMYWEIETKAKHKRRQITFETFYVILLREAVGCRLFLFSFRVSFMATARISEQYVRTSAH